MKRILVAVVLCALPLVGSAEDKGEPADMTTPRNIDGDVDFWADFLAGLLEERGGDDAGNVTLGQCIESARLARIACQRRADDGAQSEICYLREDRARQWCYRAWDRLEP